MVEDLRLDSLEGVGPVTTRKMSDAGIHNIMDLIVRGPVEIAEITGMEKDTAAKIVNKARQHLVEGGLPLFATLELSPTIFLPSTFGVCPLTFPALVIEPCVAMIINAN